MVRGLTTAASIWVVAAIGMAVSGGMYTLAIAGTGLTLVVLSILKKVENRWFRDRHWESLNLSIDPSTTSIGEIRSQIEHQGVKVEQIKIIPGKLGVGDNLTLVLSRTSTKNIEPLLDRLQRTNGVREISLNNQEFHNA
jgi:putative Mg2+ transporter-C (MgtC) family protein